MESTKSAARRLKKVYNVLNQTNTEGMNMSWKVPGFLPSDFDRKGKPHVWTALRNLEVYRGHMPHHEHHSPWMRMVVALRVTFSKRFFEVAAMDCPMVASYGLVHVGKSSMVCLVHLVEDKQVSLSGESKVPELQTPLIENVRFYAVVDKKTRRATQLPKDDVLKLKAQCHSPTSISSSLAAADIVQRVTVSSKPETGCYEYVMRTAYSDLDHLNHVNSSVFLRFALDGIDAAIVEGALGQTYKDDGRDVRKVEALNLKEVFAGAEMRAYVWVPDTNSNVVNCQLNSDGLAVFRCSVEYY